MTARRAPGGPKPASGRDPLLAQLHIARKQIGLDEGDYRDVLERVTGKRSAGDMSAAERTIALAEFQRLGWQPKRKGPGIEPRRDHRFCFVLWALLAKAGVVKGGRGALNAFICAPNFQAKWGEAATDIRFLSGDRTADVIEALKNMAARKGVELDR
jgi:hypothetical protein